MEPPGYEGEGGAGGKFRRRPFRRAAAATPYDRPPSAARGGLRGMTGEAGAGGNRWLSRLVDPASRFIAGTASKFFSSVFQKRLTAPPQPEAPGVIPQSMQEDAEVAAATPLPGPKGGNYTDQSSPTHNSETNEISKFEQVVKQKIFTRAEFEHLTHILRSRIVDSDVSGPAFSNEKLDATNPSLPENATGGPRIHGEAVKPFDDQAIPKDEAASPAELAKAYMGSRAVKFPSSALSLRSQAIHEEKTMSNGPKPFDLSVIPRSVIRSADNAQRPWEGYLTPRPPSRSAIFRMSRSPYFRAQAISDMKGSGSSKVDHVGSSSSTFQTPKSIFQLNGRQTLKRRSSVLENDVGSFGPIRRIRHKSSMISSVKGTPGVLLGNLPPSPSATLSKDIIAGSSSVQKPLQLNERSYDTTDMQNSKKVNNRASDSNVHAVPPQSSETARKIFHELGKLLPSPQEKSSKALSLDESPFKLPYSAEGQAPRNFEDSTSQLKAVQSNILGSVSDPTIQAIRSSISPKQHRIGQKDPSTSDFSGVKSTPDTNSINSSSVLATLTMPVKNAADTVLLDSHKKSAFQISASEGSSKANNGSCTDALGPLYASKDKVDMKGPQDMISSSITAGREGSVKPSSIGIPSYSSKLSKVIDTKGYVVENGLDFTFPVAAAASTYSQPPTPTMSPAMNKEQTAAPLFTFRSDTIPAMSTTTNAAASVSLADPDNSCRISPSSPTVEDSELDKGNEALESKTLFKPFGSVDLSVKSGLASRAKDGSASNGLLHTSSASFSSAEAVTLSASNTTGNTSFPSFSSNTSSAVPMFSNIPLFKLESTSLEKPPAVPQLMDKSGSTYLDEKSVKLAPFSTASKHHETGNTTSSSLMMTPQVSSTGNSSASVSSAAISSMGSSTAASTASNLFSSIGGSQSSQSPLLAFSSAGKSIFMFGSSTQSSGSSSLVVDDSLKNFGAGSVFSTQTSTSKSDISPFAQSSSTLFSSFSSSPLGLENSSSSGFGDPQVGVATAISKPFSLTSTFSFSAGAACSSPSPSFSFGQAGTTSLVAPSSQPSTSFMFGSSSSSPSSLFAFGASASASGSSSFPFGSSSGSAFTFSSASTTASMTPSFGQSVFGTPTGAVNFNSGSPSNDQMNVEDSMAEETNQAVASSVPGSGQQGSSPAAPLFGTPAAPSAAAIFQFGGHQSSVPSSPSPFQAAGSIDFASGGSFSLGSGGGGDKSNRRIIKVRHNKLRKK